MRAHGLHTSSRRAGLPDCPGRVREGADGKGPGPRVGPITARAAGPARDAATSLLSGTRPPDRRSEGGRFDPSKIAQFPPSSGSPGRRADRPRPDRAGSRPTATQAAEPDLREAAGAGPARRGGGRRACGFSFTRRACEGSGMRARGPTRGGTIHVSFEGGDDGTPKKLRRTWRGRQRRESPAARGAVIGGGQPASRLGLALAFRAGGRISRIAAPGRQYGQARRLGHAGVVHVPVTVCRCPGMYSERPGSAR